MNNEFIVWDEDYECFIDETECIFKDGTLYRDHSNFLNQLSHDLTMFWGIGKTDIESNRIYADCSIVEMTITDEDGKHRHRGHFRYNDEILCYEFVEPLPENCRRIWRMEKLQIYHVSLKIIGTLQENKELLK